MGKIAAKRSFTQWRVSLTGSRFFRENKPIDGVRMSLRAA